MHRYLVNKTFISHSNFLDWAVGDDDASRCTINIILNFLLIFWIFLCFYRQNEWKGLTCTLTFSCLSIGSLLTSKNSQKFRVVISIVICAVCARREVCAYGGLVKNDNERWEAGVMLKFYSENSVNRSADFFMYKIRFDFYLIFLWLKLRVMDGKKRLV